MIEPDGVNDASRYMTVGRRQHDDVGPIFRDDQPITK
jgi:hypothetical protein